jgi:hypothetical protein
MRGLFCCEADGERMEIEAEGAVKSYMKRVRADGWRAGDMRK